MWGSARLLVVIMLLFPSFWLRQRTLDPAHIILHVRLDGMNEAVGMEKHATPIVLPQEGKIVCPDVILLNYPAKVLNGLSLSAVDCIG